MHEAVIYDLGLLLDNQNSGIDLKYRIERENNFIWKGLTKIIESNNAFSSSEASAPFEAKWCKNVISYLVAVQKHSSYLVKEATFVINPSVQSAYFWNLLKMTNGGMGIGVDILYVTAICFVLL